VIVPGDTLAVLKLFSWGLGGTLEEIVTMRELIQRFGGFGARRFFPAGVGIDAIRPPPGSSVALDSPDPLRHALGLRGQSIGSSAFVVGGSRSSSGSPLLAADSHFEPTAPAPFYEAHLRGGPADVAGATVPGIPVVWTGFTPRVAWASTHAAAVVSDLFVESLHPSDPSRYHDGAGWREFQRREEIIEIRDADPLRLEVRETRHGPLVNDLLEEPHEPLAIRWIGALRSAGIGGLLEAARARDAEELRQALASHHEPVLVVAYADAAGAAGVQMAGFLPERSLPSGLVPVPARDPNYHWTQRIPFAELPRREVSGRQPWVVASDGDPTTAGRSRWFCGGLEPAPGNQSLLEKHSRSGAHRRGPAVRPGRRVSEGGELIETALELAGIRALETRPRRWRGRPLSTKAPLRHRCDRVSRVSRSPAALFSRRWEGPAASISALGRASPHLLHQTLVAAREGGVSGGVVRPETVREAVRSSLGQLDPDVRPARGEPGEMDGDAHTFLRALWRGVGGQTMAFGPFCRGTAAGEDCRVWVPESFSRVVRALLIADASGLDQALISRTRTVREHRAPPQQRPGRFGARTGRPPLDQSAEPGRPAPGSSSCGS
jgi:hypothetical protein